ncbi:MAG: hypothetical protein COB98_01685 [Flavobacteriaceae bacterium]|nr:MAG: hypothetical protein COB98_01685 [Flavobacteriaceae bacterium]
MVRVVKIIILSVLLISCISPKSYYLKDGFTKVPLDSNYFKKEKKAPLNVDFDAVYIVSYYVGHNYLWDYNKGEHLTRSGLRFYKNGNVSSFEILKIRIKNLPDLNPSTTGYRGVSFMKKGGSYITMFVPKTEYLRYGKKTHSIEIKGDSLFVRDIVDNSLYIYLKQKLTGGNMEYNGTW